MVVVAAVAVVVAAVVAAAEVVAVAVVVSERMDQSFGIVAHCVVGFAFLWFQYVMMDLLLYVPSLQIQ